jgi:hypothetical protein
VPGECAKLYTAACGHLPASQLVRADYAVIPLYQRLTVDARKIYLQGWQTNVDDYVT